VSKSIIIDIHHDQTRVAFMEDSDLVEMYIEGVDNQRIVGNIYRGKVVNVLPGMQAAFVDIGLEKNAFLYVGDINTDKSVFEFDEESGSEIENGLHSPSIGDILKEGQELTVQVLKEPIGTKGARITTHITLPGRYMVLMPTVNYIGVSRRIENESERQRLKSIAESIKPENMGLIVRTAALGKEVEDFTPELDFLLRLWTKIREREYRGKVPRLLHKDESIIYRTVRDLFTGDVEKLIINRKEEYEKVLEWIEFLSPSLKDRAIYFEPVRNIFEYYGIEDKIEKAVQKKVWLKNGGYIIIDPTEALTVIDVNTGKYVGGTNLEDTVLNTNLQAAEEIARQIRLRDIGGIIIIDFIDMDKTENRQQVLSVLKAALKKDRTKTNVVGFTGLGLVEMTRKKVRNRLTSSLLKSCPYCSGTGKVYSENMMLAKVENELERMSQSGDIYGIIVEVNPVIAQLLIDEECHGLEVLEDALGCKIFVRMNSSMHLEDAEFMSVRSQDEVERLLHSSDDIFYTGFAFTRTEKGFK
jgi:ribonuclease G